MALEEPTVSELIRRVQSSVEDVASDVKDLKDLQANFVSKELYVVERDNLSDRVAKLESKGREWWTIVALPAMVALLTWFIQGVIQK